MTSTESYNLYPASCRFPGCERPAPVSRDGDVALCVDHERLRFYRPDEFAQRVAEAHPPGPSAPGRQRR